MRDLQYSTSMLQRARSADALAGARRRGQRARLQTSLHLSPGRSPARSARGAPRAERAAAGLWRARPAAWSARPRRPASDRESPRLADVAGADGRLARSRCWRSPTRVKARRLHRRRAARHGRIEPRARSAARRARRRARLAALAHARLDRSGRRRAPSTTPPERTLYLLVEQVGHDDRAELAGRALPRSGSRTPASRAGPITSSRSPTKAPSSRAARAPNGFRDVFINPSDIGGRYSALSFFGIVPAALMGQDVAALVGWGLAMLAASSPASATRDEPGRRRSASRSAPARARAATS